MKIQLLKENWQQAVTMVSRFTATKSQLPILGYLAIRANDKGIFVSGTDLERGIRVRVGGKVVEEGEVGVPAKLMMELGGALPLGAVEIKANDKGLVEVVAGRMKTKIQGVLLEEFPEIEVSGEEVRLGEREVKEWEKILNSIEYAISKDEGRPVLNGVWWDFGKGRLVATDGYRLSVIEEESLKSDREEGLILEGSFLREAIKVAGELGMKKMGLTFSEQKKQAQMTGEDVLVVGRVIQGEFPKYEGILPTTFEVEAKLDRQELTAAVKAAAIFAQDSARIVKVKLEEDQVVVSANAPQVGENQVGVGVEYLKKGEMTIAFNGRYMMDFLAHAQEDEVVLRLNEPLKPGVLAELGKDYFRHVIMPVRVRGEE